jgi:hypothetical protein
MGTAGLRFNPAVPFILSSLRCLYSLNEIRVVDEYQLFDAAFMDNGLLSGLSESNNKINSTGENNHVIGLSAIGVVDHDAPAQQAKGLMLIRDHNWPRDCGDKNFRSVRWTPCLADS